MAGTDFSHLTNDELIEGIQALKLPDYIRSKAYGVDVRETLAQMTEMTIQLGINMGLSPDEALEMVKKIQGIDAQLAQTATKTEVQAVSSNVSNIIANNGDGTKDSEVVALRTDNKGHVYTSAPDRVNAIENNIDSKVTEPPIIRSVPNAQDTFNFDTDVFTQNVGEVILTGSMYEGIITDKTNYDYIFTTVIAGAKTPATSVPSGMTEYKNKNGVILEETANSNLTSDVGKYTFTDTGRIWIYVPKGTYTTIADARLELGTTVLRYQLETPVTTVKNVGSLTKELVKIRKNTDGTYFPDASVRIDGIEKSVNNFTRYLSPSRVEPPELLSVPKISDTFENGVLTKNVERISLTGDKFVGIATNDTNHDAVFTQIIPLSKSGTGGISGQTVLLDNNSVQVAEAPSTDDQTNIGKYSQRTNGRIWIYVPKGTYATIEEARLGLGTMSLRYQLEEPVISEVSGGFELDLSEKRDFSIEVTTVEETPVYFSNIPEQENVILAVTIHIKNSVIPNLKFPNGTLWKNNQKPTFESGNTHMLYLLSYDNGATWLGAKTGEW